MKTVKANGSVDMPFALPQCPTLGVLLAGGQSRRMGADKATLRFRGQRLIDKVAHELAKALSVTPDRLVVSGNVEGYHSIPDQIPGLGPIGGIKTIVETIKTIQYIIVPIDMPSLEFWVLRELLDGFKWEKSGSNRPQIGCRYFHGFELPMVFNNRPKALRILRTMCQPEHLASQRSVKYFLRQMNAMVLEPKTEPLVFKQVLYNANTPADLARLLHG